MTGMKKSRFTHEQIIGFLRQAEAGMPIKELCRSGGFSDATFYKWRAKFGGMDASLMARMKELEEENRRLKKLYVEAQITADIVAEALERKRCGQLAGARWPDGQSRRRGLASD